MSARDKGKEHSFLAHTCHVFIYIWVMLKNKKGILAIFLGVQILFIAVLKHFPEFVESYYSNGLYVFISRLMRFTFGWLSISAGDILYTIAVIYCLRWLFLHRKRMYKDFVQWSLDVLSAVSIAYFAFHVLWAFNYYREPLYRSLQIEADYTTEELIYFTKQLVTKSNTIHNNLSKSDTLSVTIPYTRDDIINKATHGYRALSKFYPHWNYEPRSIKKSIYSLPLTYMGFSGYLNPFTNEAQVDALIPTYKFPTTTCHEIAHQLGYAAENEANFIGSLAAIHNEDIYFQYTGYTFALRYCLNEIFKRDKESYYLILKTINKGIIKNYQEVQEFWLGYENPLEPLFKTTFDNFLKVNNQSGGMKSYSYVVALLVNYYKDQPL
jgi:signal transduction histidine kinase